jgi:hypothetical protein
MAAQEAGMSCMLLSQPVHGLTRLQLPNPHSQLLMRAHLNHAYEPSLAAALLLLLRDHASQLLVLDTDVAKTRANCACLVWRAAAFPTRTTDGEVHSKEGSCIAFLGLNQALSTFDDAASGENPGYSDCSSAVPAISVVSSASVSSCWALYSEDANLYEAELVQPIEKTSKKVTVRYRSYGNEEILSRKRVLLLCE